MRKSDRHQDGCLVLWCGIAVRASVLHGGRSKSGRGVRCRLVHAVIFGAVSAGDGKGALGQNCNAACDDGSMMARNRGVKFWFGAGIV